MSPPDPNNGEGLTRNPNSENGSTWCKACGKASRLDPHTDTSRSGSPLPGLLGVQTFDQTSQPKHHRARSILDAAGHLRTPHGKVWTDQHILAPEGTSFQTVFRDLNDCVLFPNGLPDITSQNSQQCNIITSTGCESEQPTIHLLAMKTESDLRHTPGYYDYARRNHYQMKETLYQDLVATNGSSGAIMMLQLSRASHLPVPPRCDPKLKSYTASFALFQDPDSHDTANEGVPLAPAGWRRRFQRTRGRSVFSSSRLRDVCRELIK